MIDISVPPSWLWAHGPGSPGPALAVCFAAESNLPALVVAGKVENITFGSLRTIIRCPQQDGRSRFAGPGTAGNTRSKTGRMNGRFYVC